MTASTAASLTKIAEGREAEVFAWDAGVVLKLYRSMDLARSAEIERAAMNAVRDAGGPAPRGLDIIEIDGRPGLLMERVDGIDMLTRIGKQPWRVFRDGSVMGRLHAMLNTAQAPVIIESLRDRLARRITQVGTLRPDLCDRGLGALARLPDDDRLCHGDFHPGNIILTNHGPIVIDWPNATRGDPVADFARTALMFRLGALPPGTPFLIRKLDRVGRWFLRSRYLASYRAKGEDVSRVGAWMLPVAIARLADGIEEERNALLEFIDSL
jgi:aminoglycoside phosphotransferase (APT) family kinase protein